MRQEMVWIYKDVLPNAFNFSAIIFNTSYGALTSFKS